MALVSKGEFLSHIRQGGIVDENPQPVTRLRLTAQIAMSISAAPQSTQAPAAAPHAPAKRDRPGSQRRPAVRDEYGVKVRHWRKHQRLHQCGHEALTARRAPGGLPPESYCCGRRGGLKLPGEVIQLSLITAQLRRVLGQ